MATRIPKPMLTKEHGSWAVLLIPIAVAAGEVGAWSTDILFLLVAALSAFVSYLPAQTVLRHVTGNPQEASKMTASVLWGSLSLAVAGVSTLYLVLNGDTLLVAFAAIALLFFLVNFFLVTRFQKTIASDLIGMAGLTLGAPALLYVSRGVLDVEAFSLYLLSLLFFGCSVVYVHMKMKVVETKRDPLSLRERLALARMNIVYHVAVIAIVGVLALRHWTPALSLVAFIPMTIHALYGTFTLSHKVRFKRLGWLLLAQSVLFALLMIVLPGV
jgi:hypothetical protein